MRDKVILSDVADIIMGQSPDSSSCNTIEKGLPFLQGCGEFGKRIPIVKNYCYNPKKISPKNSILISVRAPVGDVNLADQDYVIGRGLAGVVAKNINRNFLYYSILFFKNQLKKVSQGSTFEAINSSDLHNLKINDFGSSENRKISKILSNCDKVIEKTETAIAKYQSIKQGMMHDLFTRGIDIKTGKLRAKKEDAPELYKESELGWIPKEWEDLKFRDISVVNQGLQISISQRYKSEGENRYLYITIQYLNDTESDINRFFIENPNQSVICNKNDVLMVRTGNTGMIVTDIIGVFHNNFFKIEYKQDIDKDFLVSFLKRDIIQNLIMNYAGTTTIPDLKHGDFYNLPFIKPSKYEQVKIKDRINSIKQKIEVEQSTLSKYQQIKKGLMQDLLTGKVEVKIDEEELVND